MASSDSEVSDGLALALDSSPATSEPPSSTPEKADVPVEVMQEAMTRFKKMSIITSRQELFAERNLSFRFYRNRDLPHALEDRVNNMPSWHRNHKIVRTAFESNIRTNTRDDEPNAPRIRVKNDVDDETSPPWEFYYTNMMWHSDGVPEPDTTNLVSCDCIGGCSFDNLECACARRQAKVLEGLEADGVDPPFVVKDFLYDERGLLKMNSYPIYECNEKCQCSEECRNRVSCPVIGKCKCTSY